jgi:hypothetical protein
LPALELWENGIEEEVEVTPLDARNPSAASLQRLTK